MLDALPPGPLAVTHIGGGACTLARYVAATRPGSSQIVLEPDAALTALVRARLPLPRRARHPDPAGRRPRGHRRAARRERRRRRAGRVPRRAGAGRADHGEFLAEVARVLRPDGVLLANVADGPPLDVHAPAGRRGCGPCCRRRCSSRDRRVLRGRRYGNVVLAASRGGAAARRDPPGRRVGDVPARASRPGARSTARRPRRAAHRRRPDALAAPPGGELAGRRGMMPRCRSRR